MKSWTACRAKDLINTLTSSQRREWYDKVIERNIRKHIMNSDRIEAEKWGELWLSNKDRSRKTLEEYYDITDRYYLFQCIVMLAIYADDDDAYGVTMGAIEIEGITSTEGITGADAFSNAWNDALSRELKREIEEVILILRQGRFFGGDDL